MTVLYPAVVSALEGKDCREVMKSIAESSPIPQERLSHIVAGMYRVLSEAIRIPSSSLKQEVSWLRAGHYLLVHIGTKHKIRLSDLAASPATVYRKSACVINNITDCIQVFQFKTLVFCLLTHCHGLPIHLNGKAVIS